MGSEMVNVRTPPCYIATKKNNYPLRYQKTVRGHAENLCATHPRANGSPPICAVVFSVFFGRLEAHLRY